MYDIVVIGSGVAGMTATLYALRSNKSVLILDKEGYGGQISKSPRIENYPTHKSVSGSELADEIFDQITDLGAVFELEAVEKIEKKDNIFEVKTEYSAYAAKSVVIANGVTPRKLKLEKEDEFLGSGVYTCAICDGPFFAGEEVVLVGDGNSAMQYALMLASYCKKVILVTMFDKFFGEKVLEDAVKNTSNIEIIQNAVASKLIGENELTAVEFKRSDNSYFELKTKALFVAIGQIPDNKRFENLVNLDNLGYIISDESTETKTPGVFVAGDTRTKKVRQVATAVGDGAVAGTSAVNYINTLERQ